MNSGPVLYFNLFDFFAKKKKQKQFLLLWLKNISAFSGTREGQGYSLSGHFNNKMGCSGEEKVFELLFKLFLHGPFRL